MFLKKAEHFPLNYVEMNNNGIWLLLFIIIII